MSLLFSPARIKNLEVSSRLVMPPMASAKADENGFVTDELCRYYDEKTSSGAAGLVIAEHAYVSSDGKLSAGQISAAEDGCVTGLKRLTDVIHKNGAAVLAQITHAGAAASEKITGLPVLSAGSARVKCRSGSTSPLHVMTEDDINKTISDFAKAARRAKDAGFDGAELHSAHGYLLNQFYSPLTNDRTDSYAGSTLAGRMKLHLEIINAVRDAVGKDFILALRLGACDYEKGGATIEDGVEACRIFADAGIDLLDISGGVSGFVNPLSKEEGWFKDVSAAVKCAVSVPVILTGGIVTPAAAENLLKIGAADFIGVGRALPLFDNEVIEQGLASFKSLK
ncbi:MAG: oxidoreductase [Treponema sp.]